MMSAAPVEIRLLLDPATARGLSAIAEACGKTPSVLAGLFVRDVIEDDARAHAAPPVTLAPTAASEPAPATAASDAAKPMGMIDRAKADVAATGKITRGFIKACVGYRYAGQTPARIAKFMACDIALVREALK